MDQINFSCEKSFGGLKVHLPLPHYSYNSIHMSLEIKWNKTHSISILYKRNLLLNPFLYMGNMIQPTTTFMLVQVHPQVACLRAMHMVKTIALPIGYCLLSPTQVPSF
jgi:hypothetical protein